MLRVRMSAKDAHYGGNLVDGAQEISLTEPTWFTCLVTWLPNF